MVLVDSKDYNLLATGGSELALALRHLSIMYILSKFFLIAPKAFYTQNSTVLKWLERKKIEEKRMPDTWSALYIALCSVGSLSRSPAFIERTLHGRDTKDRYLIIRTVPAAGGSTLKLAPSS